MKRIADKIDEINEFLDQFKDIVPSSFDEYKSNIEKKAACERYVEKIVEAVTDLAFLIIKNKKLKIPEDDIDAFNILLENGIIDSSLENKLRNTKGMRNIISHQYGKIDDEIVFAAISQELDNDAREFIKSIKKEMKNYKSA